MNTQKSIFEKSLAQAGKGYLLLKDKYLPTTKEELAKRMEENWRTYEKSLRGTMIHKDLKLCHIENYSTYVSHVPVRDYDFFAPYVERVCAGQKNILFKGKPDCFGLSSGTSGQDSKKVPYNDSMIKLFLKAQQNVAGRLTTLMPKENFLTSDRLTFGSAPCVYEKNGMSFGYISGILSTKVPNFLKNKTFPSNQVLAINDWDQKIEGLIEETIKQDIRVITGIPTYIISIFEAVLKKTGKKSLNQIWPNLKVFIYAATPIKQYVDQLNELVGHDLDYFGFYAATEAPLGLPYESYEDETQLYLLNPDLLYSFTNAQDSSDIRGVHNIELGQPYFVNIGTPNGFIHYAMKDEIVFSDLYGDLVFEFVGRKNTGINLAAEKVTEDEILNTILKTKEELNFDIKHYIVSPGKTEGKQSYHWTLFTDKILHSERERIIQMIDSTLCEINLDYKDCREIGVIAPPSLTLMNTQKLQTYFERHRGKGQLKMKTSFPTSEEYFHFVKLHFSEIEVQA